MATFLRTRCKWPLLVILGVEDKEGVEVSEVANGVVEAEVQPVVQGEDPHRDRDGQVDEKLELRSVRHLP